MIRKYKDNTIKIENPKLLELANWGDLVNTQTTYPVTSMAGCDLNYIQKLIQLYISIHNYFVYPLNHIEAPIKYSYIAHYLLEQVPQLNESNINLQKGLLIKLNDNHCLHFINTFWYIVQVSEFTACYSFTTNKLGAAEYDWCLKAYKAKLPKQKFYEKFYPSLYSVTQGDLTNIEKFLSVCLTYNTTQLSCITGANTLYDVTTNRLYQFHIYPVCKVNIQNRVENYTFVGNQATMTYGHDTKTVYDFCLRPSSEQYLTEEAMTEVQVPYDEVLLKIVRFITVEYNGEVTNLYYRAFRVNNLIIIELNNRIYLTTFNDPNFPRQIAYNSRVLTIKNNILYIESTEDIVNGVRKICHSYNLVTGKLDTQGINYEKVSTKKEA